MKYLDGQYDQPIPVGAESERRKGHRGMVAETGRVKLYDLNSRLVAIHSGKIPAGYRFPGITNSGIYFARIESQSGITIKKIVIP